MAHARSLVLIAVSSLLLLSAPPRSAFAQWGQWEMDVAVWTDTWSDQEYSMLHTIAIGYDNSWGCGHWDYFGEAFVSGAASGYAFAPGLEVGLSLPNYVGGQYSIEPVFQFYCDCAFNYVPFGPPPIQVALPAQCEDERGTIIGEYASHNVNFTPTCSDFASSGGTTYFSWAEYNGSFQQGNPHSPWGIVRQPLKTGMEATRAFYDRGLIKLESGYRCPHGNLAVKSSAPTTSRHMWGEAADFYSLSHPNTPAELDLLAEAADDAGGAGILIYYPDNIHVHAVWQ